ncbi:hypothetical protein QVD17_23152 [Tagetes erecta]|uniref:Uncharacterized protein n=1 Tax=Tagetes erecta TaxID=13708 RepID=A0AAD8NU00_TARER|nr:hypothetical protein QVD17_23152 [Tagetes erecta]
MPLRKFIGAPRRLLRRARQEYVEKMIALDENVGPITNMTGFPPPAPPPPRFGFNYWTINHSTCTAKCNEVETKSEVVLKRTTSERVTTTSTSKEFDALLVDEVRHCYSSLGLGRVATIDEDKWYEFDEEINVRIDWHISKSRRQAVGRRGIGGYY